MAFLSCEEMLAAARSQKITLAEAVLLGGGVFYFIKRRR